MSAQKNTKEELMSEIITKRVAAMSKEEKLFYKNNEIEKSMFFLSVEMEANSLMLDEVIKPKKIKKSKN